MALQVYFDTVVAFGDSFSSQCGLDQANEQDRRTWTDFSHGLRDNPIIAECSMNTGWNYLNFLTDCTEDGTDPLECPIQLVDLAFGGAVASKNLSILEEPDDTAKRPALELKGQLANWREHVQPELNFNSARTLAVIWFGLNDLHAFIHKNLEKALEENHAVLIESRINQHLDEIEAAVLELHQDGIRSFFVPNIPLDVAGAAATINTWNRLLNLRLKRWKLTLPESTMLTFDVYSMYNEFQAHPDDYGFTNLEDMCVIEPVDCANLTSGYLRMDWIHWTTQTHLEMSVLMEKSIIQQIESGHQQTTFISRLSPKDVPIHLAASCIVALLLMIVAFSLGWILRQRREQSIQRYASVKTQDSA